MSIRVVFLVSARGGSHYLGRLLAADPLLNLEEPRKGRVVATVPEGLCPLYTPGYPGPHHSLYFTYPDSPFDAFVNYVADGPTCSAQSDPCGASWDSDDITGLLAQDVGEWHFVHSLRDGRNQLASLKYLEEGASTNLRWSESRLEGSCRAFQYRARVAIDNASQFNNYHLLRFEDLALDPHGTLSCISSLTGLPLDLDRVMGMFEEIDPNSSYDDLGGPVINPGVPIPDRDRIRYRWRGFSSEERETIHRIAGHELEELGYIQGSSWVEEE